MALIFDEEVQKVLELTKAKGLDGFGDDTETPEREEDVKKLYEFVITKSKTYSNGEFAWDEELQQFIEKELSKVDPDVWINKLLENKILVEPFLGSLKFLVDFGGGNNK